MTLMAGPKGQLHVYNTQSWPEGPAIIHNTYGWPKGPAITFRPAIIHNTYGWPEGPAITHNTYGRDSHMCTTLMTGSEGQPYVYNTQGWPKGPAILHNTFGWPEGPAITPSIYGVICVQHLWLARNDSHMYITFRDGPKGQPQFITPMAGPKGH